MLWRALVAVRPPSQRNRLVALLQREEMRVEAVGGAVQLWESLNREPADFVFVSESVLSRPLDPSLEGLRALPDAPSVVVVRERDDAETRAHLLGLGCAAVVEMGLSDVAVADIVRAVARHRREMTARQLTPPDAARQVRLGSFQSRSPAMQRVLEVARRVVPAESSVLILGETGVGKEHLARAIHDQGARAGHPFVAVNCAAIPETLFESELFGHEQGAFTGANRAHRGSFESAHGGTIFLDEIGETPLQVQAKLLRVLQDRRIQRVGGETNIPVDVRILAATNRDLEREVRDGRFRADLFYRIGVVSLTIPPLRERREDIPDLVRTFLDYFRERLPTAVEGVDESCMRALLAYAWPGNIRELINVLERALLITDGRILTRADLPDSVRGDRVLRTDRAAVSPPAAEGIDPSWLDLPLREAKARVVTDFERDYLAGQLRRSEGRVGSAAKRAGITARALFDKMRRHGLRKEEFKP